jgi:hypothetical protein
VLRLTIKVQQQTLVQQVQLLGQQQLKQEILQQSLVKDIL